MKRVVYLLFIFLAGCAGSPLQTGVEAEKNRMQIGDVKIGMQQEYVRDIMGPAYKKEKRIINNKEYLVWYYLTKGTLLAQSRYLDENFTPFIFSQNVLVGWGWKYFNHLFEENVNVKPQEETVPIKNQQLEETINKILKEESKQNLQPDESKIKANETSPVENALETPKSDLPKTENKDILQEKALEYQKEQTSSPVEKPAEPTEQKAVEEKINPEDMKTPTTNTQVMIPKEEKKLEEPKEAEKSSNQATKSLNNKNVEETTKDGLKKEPSTPSCEKHEHPDNYNWWE